MDDLTLTERFYASIQPGHEWAWLIGFALIVLFVALSEHRPDQ